MGEAGWRGMAVPHRCRSSGAGWQRLRAATFALHLPRPAHCQVHARSSSIDAAAAATAGGGSPVPPFHLAIPVADLAAAREFYGRCAESSVSGAGGG